MQLLTHETITGVYLRHLYLLSRADLENAISLLTSRMLDGLD
jgi:hypothetical protein